MHRAVWILGFPLKKQKQNSPVDLWLLFHVPEDVADRELKGEEVWGCITSDRQCQRPISMGQFRGTAEKVGRPTSAGRQGGHLLPRENVWSERICFVGEGKPPVLMVPTLCPSPCSASIISPILTPAPQIHIITSLCQLREERIREAK